MRCAPIASGTPSKIGRVETLTLTSSSDMTSMNLYLRLPMRLLLLFGLGLLLDVGLRVVRCSLFDSLGECSCERHNIHGAARGEPMSRGV